MAQAVPPVKPVVLTSRRKRTHEYRPIAAPGILIEYSYFPGAVCQPVPGVGPEPAYVEIETITAGGKDVAQWLYSLGFDEESLAEEILRQHA